MLIPIIDAQTKKSVWFNPKHVAFVVSNQNLEGDDITIIGLATGPIPTTEDLLSVVGKIQGELKND